MLGIHRKGDGTLEWNAQGGGAVTVPGDDWVWPLCHGLVDKMLFGRRLNAMVSELFSSLIDLVILWLLDVLQGSGKTAWKTVLMSSEQVSSRCMLYSVKAASILICAGCLGALGGKGHDRELRAAVMAWQELTTAACLIATGRRVRVCL